MGAITIVERTVPRRLVRGADDLGAVGGVDDEGAAPHARAQASAAASKAGSSTVTRACGSWRWNGTNVSRPLRSTVARSPQLASSAAGCAALRPRQSAGGKRSPSSTMGRPASIWAIERIAIVAFVGASAAHALRDLAAQILAQRGAHVEAGIDQEQRVGGRRLDGGECGHRAVTHGDQALVRLGKAPRELVQAVADIGDVRLERGLLERERALAAAARIDQQRAVPAAASARTSRKSTRRARTASTPGGETTSTARRASGGPPAMP